MPPLENEPWEVDGEGMSPQMRDLDAQVVAVLERKPRVEIPEGFAALVASQVVAYKPVSVSLPRYGRTAVTACAGLSLVAMLLLAPRTVGHDPFWMALQWVLCGQFCVLTAWLGLSQQEAA